MLHLRQLSVFGMICRLPDHNPLKLQAFYISSNLSDKVNSKKLWFSEIIYLCSLYSLPSCSHLLNFPLSKDNFKTLINSRILDYWQILLRKEAQALPSLKYFNPEFYSLKFPCVAYKMAGSNRYEIAKLKIQLLMTSGRFRTERQKRFWSGNTLGNCLTSEECKDTPETLSHILISCPGLETTRTKLLTSFLATSPYPIKYLLTDILTLNDEQQTQFFLEPLSNPNVISMIQDLGVTITEKICYITRTFCFSLHRRRLIIKGSWRGSGYPAPSTVTSSPPAHTLTHLTPPGHSQHKMGGNTRK